jgi:hypothetical protein
MANQSKLKAWVRYDGTNTVVTAGPIFRASKPKVGNWRQINADLCCNPSGTTTTTTTSGGNITTTTSTTIPLVVNITNVRLSNDSRAEACFNSMIPLTTVYTTTPYGNYPDGTILYFDEQLTQPVNYNYVSTPGLGLVYDCSNGVLSNGGGCF